MVAVFDNRTDYTDIQCIFCAKTYTLIYNREDMLDWLSGSMFIQDALPYLSDAERELLLSQICGDCFEKMFPPLDYTE